MSNANTQMAKMDREDDDDDMDEEEEYEQEEDKCDEDNDVEQEDGEEDQNKDNNGMDDTKDEDLQDLPEEEETNDTVFSKFFLQHGAHREYKIPESFIKHEARKPMSVSGGERIGEMLASRSGKVWEGLSYVHVHIAGGFSQTNDREEAAPYVCFKPPDDCEEETDDEFWFRPIPAQVIKYCQPIWKANIQERYKKEPEKAKRAIKMYGPVLNWSESDFTGPKLDPACLGIGKKGFSILKRKLKSIAIKPEVTPRLGGKQKGPPAKPKLVSAINKGTAGRVDVQTEIKSPTSSLATAIVNDSDLSIVSSARVVKIGAEEKTHTYTKEGIVYATIFV